VYSSSVGSDCVTGKMHVQVAIHRFPTLKYGCIHRAPLGLEKIPTCARVETHIEGATEALRERHFSNRSYMQIMYPLCSVLL